MVLVGGTIGSQAGRAFPQFGSVQVSDCMVCAEFVPDTYILINNKIIILYDMIGED